MKNHLILWLLVSTLGFGCEREIPPTFEEAYDFAEGLNGWQVDFADYPPDRESQFQLSSELALLPAPLDQTRPALLVSGTNRSDDLMMYLYREYTGVKPNTQYEMVYQVQLASQYPENSVGIGGSPGASVYLKAGGRGEPPTTSLDNQGILRLNYDLGSQANGGEDGLVLGTIGIEGDEQEWTLIERDNFNQPISAISDGQGRLWFIVATDSGFEGNTTVYYSRMTVRLQEVP